MARGSGRRAASRVRRELHAFTVGGISEARLNIVGGKIREVVKDLLRRHSGREVLQDVIYGDSHSANAGFTAALSRFDRYDVAIIHGAAPRSRFQLHYNVELTELTLLSPNRRARPLRASALNAWLCVFAYRPDDPTQTCGGHSP